MTFRNLILDYVKGVNRCLEELSQQDVDGIADMIVDAYKKGRRIFIMGNGGSATTASHFAQGLRQIGVQAFSLVDNIAIVTALANDVDYRAVFEKQLMGLVEEGDMVIGITASGNSPNILKATEFARKNGVITIGFIGFGGGKFKELADKCVVLSSRDYGQVEDVHLSLAHIVSRLVKEKMGDA